MSKIFKKLTVEIKSGRKVTVGVYVYGSGKNSSSQISSVDFEIPGNGDDLRKLSQDEKNEVEKLIGEKIDGERWNFDK
jgi:hypothetical protein